MHQLCLASNPSDWFCVVLLYFVTELTDTKTEKVAELISEFHGEPIKKLLVVGCGAGIEAAILAQRLMAEVTGIDLKDEFDAVAARYCELRTGDAMNLDFAAESFDFVFSYHALEHIDDPIKALGEIRRVLKPSGGFWIGTPNKSRLIGYIGGKNASLREKIRWNMLDWRMRVAGRFENKFGAHAGFKRDELKALLASVFTTVDDRTLEYFAKIYPNKLRLLRAVESSPFSRLIYPSVYFTGRK